MKKTIFLFIVSAFILFPSCKKSSTAPATMNTRVGNIYEDSNHLSTLYYYSPTYLIKGDYDDAGNFSYTYHYLNGQSAAEVQLNGMPAYSVFYIWNSRSLVDSSNILNTNGGIGIRKKYTYDANNYLTNVNWYSGTNALVMTESFTVTNGNITQHTYNAIDTSNTALPRGSYTYQYYAGMANTLSNLYFGQSYMGTSSTNPVKSVTYTNGSITTVTDYTYNYSGGLITSQLVFSDSAGVPAARVDSFAYSYYIQ